MLTVKNIIKRFGENVAVDDVTFSVKPREIFSLIGPNGSGKTTIVKLVAGLLNLNAGGIEVGGYDVSKNPLKTKAAIGYIPDEPAAWLGMTGEEFLHFIGALYGMGEKERKEKISGLFRIFRFDGIEKEYFENYSRGNKQKFTILAAFLHEPKLLLIDEPIVGLDPESASVAKKLFSDFAAKGGAILLVTHTLSVAEEISTTIGVLKKGKLISVGTLGELRERGRKGLAAHLEEIYEAITS